MGLTTRRRSRELLGWPIRARSHADVGFDRFRRALPKSRLKLPGEVTVRAPNRVASHRHHVRPGSGRNRREGGRPEEVSEGDGEPDGHGCTDDAEPTTAGPSTDSSPTSVRPPLLDFDNQPRHTVSSKTVPDAKTVTTVVQLSHTHGSSPSPRLTGQISRPTRKSSQRPSNLRPNGSRMHRSLPSDADDNAHGTPSLTEGSSSPSSSSSTGSTPPSLASDGLPLVPLVGRSLSSAAVIDAVAPQAGRGTSPGRRRAATEGGAAANGRMYFDEAEDPYGTTTSTLGKRVAFRGPSTPNPTLSSDGRFPSTPPSRASPHLGGAGRRGDPLDRSVLFDATGADEDSFVGQDQAPRGAGRRYGWRPGYEPLPSHPSSPPPTTTRSATSRSPLASLGFGGRKRLHPLTLLPAFAFGLLVAFSETPGRAPRDVLEDLASPPTTSWASTLRKPWSSWRSAFGGTGKRPAREQPWMRLPSPYAAPYTVHPTNGHVYLSPDFALHGWVTSPSPSPASNLTSSPFDDLRSLDPSNSYYSITGAPRPPVHPILALMHNATSLWNSKLASQSTTLREAVREYKRRHGGRNPPRGFGEWWEWVSREVEEGGGGVVLRDEYDRIWETIEPFWALPPSEIRARREKYLEAEVFSTFIVKDGEVTSIGGRKDAPRAKDQLELMKAFLKYLPDVNITMSHHDGPSVFFDHQTKQKYLDYARQGKLVPPEELDQLNDDPSLWGFPLLCPPDSRLRRADLGLEIDRVPNGPAFVGNDHARTMDLCENPEWQNLHGFTAWSGPRPRKLDPIFTFADLSITSDLLAAPLEQFTDVSLNSKDARTWSEKTEERLLWKGRTTGVWFDAVTRWRSSQRVRLHALGTAKEGNRRVRFLEPLPTSTRDGSMEGHEEEVVRMVERDVPIQELNKRYLDASFVGKLEQCTEADGSCAAIPKHIEFGPYLDWPRQNMYKYMIDVDGNSWSGRFRRLLASHSLVFKASIWPEWYRDHIVPWYHYVPARIDYSDLYDLMTFFSGDMEGKHGHDALAEQISDNGFEFVRKHWRYEDLQAYTWRMYLEWARVTSDDRDSMDFVLEDEE